MLYSSCKQPLQQYIQYSVLIVFNNSINILCNFMYKKLGNKCKVLIQTIEGHITKVKKITSDDTLMSVKRVLHRELKRSITTRCQSSSYILSLYLLEISRILRIKIKNYNNNSYSQCKLGTNKGEFKGVYKGLNYSYQFLPPFIKQNVHNYFSAEMLLICIYPPAIE